MKSFVIFAIICGVIGLSKSMTPDERKAFEKQLMEQCSKKEGATDADMVQITAREMPTTQTAKCFHACILETTGILKDGKSSTEGLVELTKMAFDGDEKLANMSREIGEECKDVADADRCEMSFKMMQCAMAASEKRGLNWKDMI